MKRGLAVSVGRTSPAPGALSMGAHAGADVPFAPGDEFPFEDRALAAVDCDASLAELGDAARLAFFLEVRRCLQPRGAIEITVDAETPSARAFAQSAMRAGLAPRMGTHGALRFEKPNRLLSGNPLVSIAIPAYNPRFFAEALDSALAQTYLDIEILVCDDSPESTIEAIVRQREDRAAIRYGRNQARLGPRGNFTRCLESARGEFVKFLCDDDRLEPRCVASLLDAFRRAPDITLATSRRRRIDERGAPLDDQPATAPIVAGDAVIAGRSLGNAMILAGLNTIGEPSTTLFRTADLLEQVPGYFRFGDEPGHGIIDMVSWAALLLRGDAVYLEERLSSFRIHDGQRQHDPAKAQRNIASIRSLQAAWLTLELDSGLNPDELLVKPFPHHEGADWRTQPVLGFAARRVVAS
jgi:glycosyltransferase involved in cell wall biosynthesis